MKNLLIIFVLVSFTNAAKILVVFPGVAHSHYTVGYSLAKELAIRGHEVTFVNPFKEKTPVPNLKNVVLKGFADIAEEMTKKTNLFDMYWMPSFVSIVAIGNMGIMLAEETLKNEAMQNILKSDEQFDLVITESFLCDALHGLAYHYKVPSVQLATIGPTIWTNHVMGAPDIHSYMPIMYISYPDGMPFHARLYNTILCLYQKLYDRLYFYPQHEKLLKTHFPDTPHVLDLVYNTSLTLFNSHISYNTPHLLTNNMVEIGGYHVQKPQKLPEDLQSILDGAPYGVIYFSMGSNLKSSKLSQELKGAILRVFSKLKQKVLWKFEEDLPGAPANVIVRKWFPQNDVLAHPNVRLFITHGGLLSTIEAIYHGVPLVGIPVFGDQSMNVGIAVNGGYAVRVPYRELSEESLSKGIDEVLTNTKYAEEAKRRSRLMHDQLVKPMDKAIYWVEYVMRHKGATHYYSPARKLNVIEYYLIDVILFLTVVTIALFVIFYLIIKWILGRKKPPKGKAKKQ